LFINAFCLLVTGAVLLAQTRLAITGVTVVDVESASLRPNQTVVVEGGVITDVTASRGAPRNARSGRWSPTVYCLTALRSTASYTELQYGQ